MNSVELTLLISFKSWTSYKCFCAVLSFGRLTSISAFFCWSLQGNKLFLHLFHFVLHSNKCLSHWIFESSSMISETFLQVMEMSSFDSWGQTKTAHQIQIFQGNYRWNFKGNTDAMSCERQFADSWLAGVQCTVASTAHSKYYSTGNFRTTIVIKLCWPVVNCVLRGTKAHRRKTESPWDRMISLSQDILTTVKYPVYEDATISTINLTV